VADGVNRGDVRVVQRRGSRRCDSGTPAASSMVAICLAWMDLTATARFSFDSND